MTNRNSGEPELFYLALDDELLIFEFKNTKWVVHSELKNSAPQVVALDPLNENVVYCGTFDKGLWKSEDAGETWKQMGKDAITHPVTSLAVSSNEQVRNGGGEEEGGGVLYVGTEPSMLYRSDDGGESFKTSNEILSLASSKSWSFPPRPYTHHVRTIVPDPKRPGLLYLAIEAGALIRSFDGGKTWKDKVRSGPFDTHNLAANLNSPGRLYSAAGDGYFESSDYGETWKRLDEGLEQTYLYSAAVNPGDADTILVSASEGPYSAYNPENAQSYIYRKKARDGWRLVKEGLPEPSGTTASFLLPNPKVASEFYAANNNGIYVSLDAGDTWETLDMPWPESGRSHVNCVALGN